MDAGNKKRLGTIVIKNKSQMRYEGSLTFGLLIKNRKFSDLSARRRPQPALLTTSKKSSWQPPNVTTDE